ncbi:MAG: hypothetical protein JO102_04750 [Elusimicrobia bacterium]|nr:hypothetical protein [Elusimicrobiota bacterium]
MKPAATFLLFCLPLSACGSAVSFHPVTLNSDPNQETLQRWDDQAEEQRVSAFIADHPELDAQTKKELRDGTISRHEALERLKARQDQKKKPE